MANVTCEYDSSTQQGGSRGGTNGSLQIDQPANDGSTVGRRVRRSEAILRQAAECVSRGETFQTVSDLFNIPISTIRFYMARKGILPRRKRGRTAILPYVIAGGSSQAASSSSSGSQTTIQSSSQQQQQQQQYQNRSRSASPLEPPYHFANYKLPELRPKLV